MLRALASALLLAQCLSATSPVAEDTATAKVAEASESLQDSDSLYGSLPVETFEVDTARWPVEHGPNRALIVQPKCVPAKDAGAACESQRYPAFVFSHADWAGGVLENAIYYHFFNQVASRGFVVVAPLGCWKGCHTKQRKLFDVAYALISQDSHTQSRLRVDRSIPLVVAGHSTGGLNVMQEVARGQRGVAGYGLKLAGGLALNPDLVTPEEHVHAPTVPLAVFSGTDDWFEPKGSAWTDFETAPAQHRFAFVEWQGTGHLNMISTAGRYGLFAPAVAVGMLAKSSPTTVAARLRPSQLWAQKLLSPSYEGSVCRRWKVAKCIVQTVAWDGTGDGTAQILL